MPRDRASACSAGDVLYQALVERTKTSLSTDFQYTNGERPHYVDGRGTMHYRQVLEVLEARISFDAGKCW